MAEHTHTEANRLYGRKKKTPTAEQHNNRKTQIGLYCGKTDDLSYAIKY